jgi:hypothetical protein
MTTSKRAREIHMIKRGDKVKVSKPRGRHQHYNSEIGYGEVWTELMDVWHNKVVTVEEVVFQTGIFYVREDHGTWAFPIMCIKEVV